MAALKSIEYKGLLDRTGTAIKGLFIVNGQEIKIGISDSLIAVWQIQKTEKIISKFIEQYGPLKIMSMNFEGGVQDYTFTTYDLQKDGQTMPLVELEDYLKEAILKKEDAAEKIGFKY